MSKRASIFLAGLVLAAFVALSGRFLVVDQPQPADAIVVLAGETEARPAKGVELLSQGYAPLMILDVPDVEKIYGWSEPELAGRFVQRLPQANKIVICRIAGRSTKAESHDVQSCLQRIAAKHILLVSSEFHTRRALSTFRREDPVHEYSIAAALDTREFGVNWWQRRQWAKTNFYEWIRLLWWQLVDRWQR